MPRYFLHLRDGTDIALDPEGIEFADTAALRAGVLACARDCVAQDAHDGHIDLRLRIDAEDESQRVVYSLAFAEAVNVIPPREEP